MIKAPTRMKTLHHHDENRKPTRAKKEEKIRKRRRLKAFSYQSFFSFVVSVEGNRGALKNEKKCLQQEKLFHFQKKKTRIKKFSLITSLCGILWSKVPKSTYTMCSHELEEKG